MKIDGVALEGSLAKPHEDCLVLPRGKQRIVIWARALSDLGEFHTLCSLPKPKTFWDKTKGHVADTECSKYKSRLATYAARRLGFMVTRSLTNIEFDSVVPDDPNTWGNWESELEENAFNQNERNRILGLVMDVNSLNEQKIASAREAFLIGQEIADDVNESPKDDRETT